MAIAFDTAVDGADATATSITWSHTCTGSNLALAVFAYKGGTTDTVTGITYNGIAMTQSDTDSQGIRAYLYYLLQAQKGANNVVVSSSSSVHLLGLSSSYTGVKARDAHGIQKTSASGTFSQSLTSTVSNTWMVAGIYNSGGTHTAGTGTTNRVTKASDANAAVIADSNSTQASPGTVTLNESRTGTPDWLGIALQFSASSSPIVFDASSSRVDSTVGAASKTLASYTVASGGILFVIVGWNVTAGSAANGDITGVTYDGVSLTQVAVKAQANWASSIWVLTNPTTGSAKSIIVTSGNILTGTMATSAQSYTGCSTTQVDASGTLGTTSSSATQSVPITVVASNCWLVSGYSAADDASPTGNNLTRRELPAQQFASGDTNGEIGTGSQNAIWNSTTSGGNIAATVVSLTPASTDLNISVSDTLTITESITKLLQSFISVVDTLTVTESISMNLRDNPSVSDALTCTESINMNLVNRPNIVDTLTVTESITMFLQSYDTLNDTLTVTESISKTLSVAVNVNDALTATEVVTTSGVLSVNVNDTLTCTESMSVFIALLMLIDTLTVTESVTVFRYPLLDVLNDTLTCTESVSVQVEVILLASVNDTLTCTENTSFENFRFSPGPLLPGTQKMFQQSGTVRFTG